MLTSEEKTAQVTCLEGRDVIGLKKVGFGLSWTQKSLGRVGSGSRTGESFGSGLLSGVIKLQVNKKSLHSFFWHRLGSHAQVAMKADQQHICILITKSASFLLKASPAGVDRANFCRVSGRVRNIRTGQIIGRDFIAHSMEIL